MSLLIVNMHAVNFLFQDKFILSTMLGISTGLKVYGNILILLDKAKANILRSIQPDIYVLLLLISIGRSYMVDLQ